MASTSSSEPPIWSKANMAQHDIVHYHSSYSQKLNGNLGILATIINLINIWPCLRQLEVVDIRMQNTIKSEGANDAQVMMLMDRIQQGPLWKMHAFFRALCLNSYDHVVEKTLGLNPDDYRKPGDKEEMEVLKLDTQIEEPKKSRWMIVDRLMTCGKYVAAVMTCCHVTNKIAPSVELQCPEGLPDPEIVGALSDPEAIATLHVPEKMVPVE